MTDTTINVSPLIEDVYSPKMGDILVDRHGLAYVVSITDYNSDFKLIGIRDGSRWSDDPIAIALKTLTSAHGPLRVAKKATLNIEF